MLVDFLTHPSGPSVVVILCVIAVGVALVEAILPGVLPRPMLDVVSAVLNVSLDSSKIKNDPASNTKLEIPLMAISHKKRE